MGEEEKVSRAVRWDSRNKAAGATLDFARSLSNANASLESFIQMYVLFCFLLWYFKSHDTEARLPPQ